jgi:hypothetical protein
LYAIRSKDYDNNKLNVLVTGGVHGYETSGVQGAILFVREVPDELLDKYNVCVLPCVTPWAYEHIQRWNSHLEDPNRSFHCTVDDETKQTKESRAVMNYFKHLQSEQQQYEHWDCHLDLHETTDTDASEFMPAKHARAGMNYEGETIPDGFYLVGDSVRSNQIDFLKAIIDSVERVTHIAEPDSNNNIIDEPVVSDGVIVVPARELGLCCSVTDAPFVATTEVYPDSPRGVTNEDCNRAQVAAIIGAMEYVLSHKQKQQSSQ